MNINASNEKNSMIIEWNKADVPEPQKLDFANFEKLTHIQAKVIE